MTNNFSAGWNEVTTPVDDDNLAFTENGAVAFKSTKSAMLDFFATGGAMRERSAQSIVAAFDAAFAEEPLLATKSLFYFRDIREGQGERSTFKILLNWLAVNHPDVVKNNMFLIPEYGRWDDIYALLDTPVENDMWKMVSVQLQADMKNEKPSLLAKWLKSENTSSVKTKELARRTRKALHMNSVTYRKTLSSLRKRIGLVEQQMSANNWDGINYQHVPSKAGLIYHRAFSRHDNDRYRAYLKSVARGEQKINVGTLYPYEIVEKILYPSWGSDATDADTFQVMWDNLPDYFGDSKNNSIVVADVSGSMYGRPMAVSVSLALYTAERNKGAFHNKFITFSSNPHLHTVQGSSVVRKVHDAVNAEWGMSTNIKGVFDLILEIAKQDSIAPEELPTHVYIVSDMEFDACARADKRLFEVIADEYKQAGYQMPFLVFWNVNSRNTQQPMTMDKRGFQMVSGCSPSIFTALMKNQFVGPYDLMLEVLNSERYAAVTL